MTKNFRAGAIGALMDEYERAAREFQALIREIGEDEFAQIADAKTTDEDCRSIQTVSRHVVMAGYSYANYIRGQFSLAAEAVPRAEISHAELSGAIDKMLAYTIETLDGKWEMSDEEMGKIVINSRWGVTYDLEQLLEHAIVHILRHRRQVEKFLLRIRK